MSLSIVLYSDLGIPGADSLELKIAYALWEAERASLTIFLHNFCGIHPLGKAKE